MTLLRARLDVTAKKYLQQAYILDNKIRADKAELDRVRSLAEAVRPAPRQAAGAMLPHAPGDRLGEAVADIEELENRLIERLEQYILTMGEIESRIGRLEDETLKLVLRKRYLCYERWDKIAGDLNYHVSHIWRMHSRALQCLAAQ